MIRRVRIRKVNWKVRNVLHISEHSYNLMSVSQSTIIDNETCFHADYYQVVNKNEKTNGQLYTLDCRKIGQVFTLDCRKIGQLCTLDCLNELESAHVSKVTDE